MKNCVLLEKGIAYDGGKMIPWHIFYGAVQQLMNYEVVERMQKNQKKFVKFQDIDRGQTIDLDEELPLLGVRRIEEENVEATRRRVLKRIDYLNRIALCKDLPET